MKNRPTMINIPADFQKNIDSFSMADAPTTFDQFDEFCEATSREKPNDYGFGRGNRPVVGVSWHDAQAYCEWLSKETGQVYRLPTEEEWEHACRAGSDGDYCFGNDQDELGDYAWYYENSDGTTHPVRLKKPNKWGLYDMHGNVWEWTASEYKPKKEDR